MSDKTDENPDAVIKPEGKGYTPIPPDKEPSHDPKSSTSGQNWLEWVGANNDGKPLTPGQSLKKMGIKLG